MQKIGILVNTPSLGYCTNVLAVPPILREFSYNRYQIPRPIFDFYCSDLFFSSALPLLSLAILEIEAYNPLFSVRE